MAFGACRKILTMLLTLWIIADAGAEEKTLHLKTTHSPVVVDGAIDPVWSTADSTHTFFQLEPYYGRPPLHYTVAKLLTDRNSLYCLIVCRDEREHIQHNTGKQDEFSGDMVSLMLDTFGDRRSAYKFAVYAGGNRGDCRLLDDGRDRDFSWDGVWFSASRVYDWGWAAEMEIPYRSIQYDETLNAWGLDFDRWTSKDREDIYWNLYEQNEGQRISKFGRMVFTDYHPSVKGINLELYPVALNKAELEPGGKWRSHPTAGIDIFYNPSQRLTFQLTANPDFAQIEADPYEFNISRYETYYEEKRPFFTEGNEVFMPSGRQQDTGFYHPLELFYSRRIGRKLSDGHEVPLQVGSKAFGRYNQWEYGGFFAASGEKRYEQHGSAATEPAALFSSVRLKRQILGNSSIGLLYVGKNDAQDRNGVIDLDGAFRSSDYQVAYQIARSYKNDQGGYAGSLGLWMPKEKFLIGLRSRYIGDQFDIQEVGYVPWQGTWSLATLSGPRWFFQNGAVSETSLYGGVMLNYEKIDDYTDHLAVLGYNMQFRSGWGLEIEWNGGNTKDMGIAYHSKEVNIASWYQVSPTWNGEWYAGYSHAYNFSRSYLANYGYWGAEVEWQASRVLNLGASATVLVEGNPKGRVEEITFNARPYFSWTPMNGLNARVYVDHLLLRSTGRIERLIGGFLLSYNLRSKSWFYFALNERQDRSDEFNASGRLLPRRMHMIDRVNVIKLKYLFYF